ncbi:cytochrome C [Chromatium weissei]|nr:cytochrome C [Chromatium weissei]
MNNSKRILTIVTVGLLSLGAVGVAFSEDDDDERGKQKRGSGWVQSRADVAPVTNATYGKECSSCHMAYQPGLLPASAWAQVMTSTALSNHYGDDASLSETSRVEISDYLSANAADRSAQTRSQAFAVADAPNAQNQGDALPRITKTRYFVRKHDEIPMRFVTGNSEVGSFSQCHQCHRGAANGVYNEHQVNIPGHGAWAD